MSKLKGLVLGLSLVPLVYLVHTNALAGAVTITNVADSRQDVFIRIKGEKLCYSSILLPGNSVGINSAQLNPDCRGNNPKLIVSIVPGNVVSTNAIRCFWSPSDDINLTLTSKDGKLDNLSPGAYACSNTY